MKILMLGDSITEGFYVKSLLSDFDITNKGVSGDSTVETLDVVNNLDFNIGYDRIFLCIGTNDIVRNRANEQIIRNILKIIDRLNYLTPKSEVYLFSIFPTRENVDRPNKRIIEINENLSDSALERNYVFINLYDDFIDLNGKLKEEFTEDGLHLTLAGYYKWKELLIEYLK